MTALLVDLGDFIALLWPAAVPVLGIVLALVIILSIIAPLRAFAERG